LAWLDQECDRGKKVQNEHNSKIIGWRRRHQSYLQHPGSQCQRHRLAYIL
jgi:hypothetical protein